MATIFKDGMFPLHFRRRVSFILTILALLIGTKLGMPNAVTVLAEDDAPFSKIAFFSRQVQNDTLHIIDPLTAKDDIFPFNPGSPSWGFPVWSPTCDRIALDRFQNNQKVVDVVTYGAEGIASIVPPGGPITITAYFPSWSPDGNSFAFQGLDTAHPEGNFEIYTVSTIDGSITNLTNDSVQDVNADWSPDGQQVVFAAIPRENNPKEYFDIYVVNSDGSSMKAIYADPETEDFNPYWSLDQTGIAFISRTENGDRLLLLNMDGSIIALTGATLYSLGHFSWSHNSQYIAFTAKTAADDSQILLLDVNSKLIKSLTDTSHTVNQYASWSPDDSQLVFQSNRDGDFEIYTLDLAMKTITQLTHNDYDDIYPAWSPKTCSDTGYVFQGGMFDLNCPQCVIPTAIP